MIKNTGRRKLSVTGSHRKAMLRNMASSLFQHEKVQTTLSRAKELKSFSESLLTAARGKDLNARKAIAGEIKNKEVQQKIFDVLAPRYEARAGGYTRLFRLGRREGDGAEIAVVKLVM
jgi:ribosomal protein L17